MPAPRRGESVAPLLMARVICSATVSRLFGSWNCRLASKPPTGLCSTSLVPHPGRSTKTSIAALAENRIGERATLLSKTMVAIIFGDSIAGCDLRSERKATGSRRVREARWDRRSELQRAGNRPSKQTGSNTGTAMRPHHGKPYGRLTLAPFGAPFPHCGGRKIRRPYSRNRSGRASPHEQGSCHSLIALSL